MLGRRVIAPPPLLAHSYYCSYAPATHKFRKRGKLVNLSRNDLIVIVGAFLAVAGVFLPMVNVGGLGTISYAKAASPEVYLLVACSIAAAGMIFADRRKFSLYAAIGAWLVLLWPVIQNMGPKEDRGMFSNLADKALDPLQKVTGDLFGNIFNFEIGGFAFLIGMVLLLVGGIMNYKAVK